jgi:hypothetical protein
LNDSNGIAWRLLSLGELNLLWDHDPAAARARFEESLSRFRAIANTFGIALTLRSLGRFHPKLSLSNGRFKRRNETGQAAIFFQADVVAGVGITGDRSLSVAPMMRACSAPVGRAHEQ